MESVRLNSYLQRKLIFKFKGKNSYQCNKYFLNNFLANKYKLKLLKLNI